jgi:PTH1 family peptidyl-tRNA hydrolase
MILIIGLGNPGSEYSATRHNFGFMAVDALAEAVHGEWQLDKKAKAEVSDMHQAGAQASKIVLMKPHTFMNLSGEAVGEVSRFYKIEPKHIWVIADDLDLPLGKIRVRFGGESGGHNGLKSVSSSLASEDYWRIRLGIRGDALRAEHIENAIDATDFVTRPFENREKSFVDKTIAQTVMILREGVNNGELKAHTWEIDGFDESSASLI